MSDTCLGLPFLPISSVLKSIILPLQICCKSQWLTRVRHVDFTSGQHRLGHTFSCTCNAWACRSHGPAAICGCSSFGAFHEHSEVCFCWCCAPTYADASYGCFPVQAKFGWHFENLAHTPDCLDTADADRIRNDGVIRQLLDEEMETLKVRKPTLFHCG